MSTAVERLNALPVTRLHLLAGVLCAVGLGADLMEIAVANGLAAVFSAAPYHMDPARLGRLLSALYVGAVLGTPLLGWAADRWGPKWVIMPAFLWLGLTSCLAATRVDFVWLSTLRFLSGLSLGALPPLTIAYLSGIVPPHYRGRAIFWVSAASFLAAPATVFLIRWLTPLHPFDIAGWRWPFAVGGVAALAVGAGFSWLPEPPGWLLGKGRSAAAEQVLSRFERSARPFDADASPQRSGAAAALAHQPTVIVPPLAMSAPQLTASPPRSTDSGTPRFKSRFGFFAALSFLQPWATVGFSIVAGPLLLKRGYDLSSTLLYVGMSMFGPALSTLLAGFLVDRFQRRTSLMLSIFVMLLSAGIFFTLPTHGWMLTAVLVFGIAVGFLVPLMSTYGAEIFPTAIRASALTGAWAINRIASALVPLFILPLAAGAGKAAVSAAIYWPLLLALVMLALFGPRGAPARAAA